MALKVGARSRATAGGVFVCLLFVDKLRVCLLSSFDYRKNS